MHVYSIDVCMHTMRTYSLDVPSFEWDAELLQELLSLFVLCLVPPLSSRVVETTFTTFTTWSGSRVMRDKRNEREKVRGEEEKLVGGSKRG